jgi:GAF domain-containing protein
MTQTALKTTRPRSEAVLQAMLDVARQTVGTTSQAGVADALVRIAARLVGADQATLGVVRDGEVVTIAASTPARMPVGSRFPVGFGVAGWVAATGQAAEIEDVRQDRRYVALPYPEVRSFVGLPLQPAEGEDLVGVLSLATWRPGAFPVNTAAALRRFTEYAAALLRHAEVTERLANRVEVLEDANPEGPAACGRAVRPTEVVDPRELVEAALERIRHQAVAREITLTQEVDPHVRPVCVDRAAIQQVLSNLLQNALGLVPAQSEITVAVTSLPEWTCVMVADRGPGLPEDQLQTIFQPYAQGDSRGGERAPGNVGLGLSLSLRLIEQHQGMIWAENREDGGSRFCFALPAVEDE